MRPSVALLLLYDPSEKKLCLPSLVLANARSVNNKTDELIALIKYHYAYKNTSAIAITETWLHSDIEDSHVEVDGFDIFRADRDQTACDKTCGGGCMWLIRKTWCTNTSVNRCFLSKDLDLELIHLKCRPHFLPRELNVIHLFAVYIPPDADKKAATNKIDSFIDTCVANQPDSAIIIAGDFNKAKLTSRLYQHVTINTREERKLDLCYSNIKHAYKSYKLPPLGSSEDRKSVV